MKLSSAKVWIYLTSFDMGDFTWMRCSWMLLVYKLKHDFENLGFWGKDDFFFFFFFKMDEAWPNAPSLKMDTWFLEILIFFFFFFFFKIKEAWPNAPSLWIDAWLLKTLIFEENMISFVLFFKWMRHGWMPLV